MEYIELFGGEGASTNTCCIRFDHPDGFDDTLRGNAESSAHSADGSCRRCDEGIRSKIKVKHDCIGALTEDAFVGEEGRLHECHGINDIIAQLFSISLYSQITLHTLRWYLIANKFSLHIIFKVSVSFVSTHNQSSKTSLKLLPIKQMMHTDSTTRGLG